MFVDTCTGTRRIYKHNYNTYLCVVEKMSFGSEFR